MLLKSSAGGRRMGRIVKAMFIKPYASHVSLLCVPARLIGSTRTTYKDCRPYVVEEYNQNTKTTDHLENRLYWLSDHALNDKGESHQIS